LKFKANLILHKLNFYLKTRVQMILMKEKKNFKLKKNKFKYLSPDYKRNKLNLNHARMNFFKRKPSLMA
jgi:hypothetical protein